MKSKKITLGLLLFYLMALTWIIIFKMQLSFADLPHIRNININPFGAPMIVNGKTDFSEIIQNAVAFIPFGLLIHVLWKQKSFLKQCAPMFCTSLLFECTQFVFSIGTSDITDVIANTAGGIAGIILAAAISKAFKKNWITVINVLSFIGAVMATLLIAILLLVNR